MLILASYIRQRASDEGPDPNGTFHYNEEGTIFNGTFPSGMEDDHLGFTQLQVKKEDLSMFDYNYVLKMGFVL